MSAFAEDEEEYEEISDEEKLKIATHFILSTPTGEVSELLNDVKKIIPSSVLGDDQIKGILRTYNVDQQTLGETTGGDSMLVSKHGEIDDNHYVDPRAGKVYGFNHTTQVRVLFFLFFFFLYPNWRPPPPPTPPQYPPTGYISTPTCIFCPSLTFSYSIHFLLRLLFFSSSIHWCDDNLFTQITHTISQSWEVSDVKSADGNDSIEEHRSAVQTAMDEYISTQFGGSSDANAACAVYGTSDGNLVVCCTGVATNLRNWWSGSWKGEYMINLADGSCQINGKVDLLAHYFEDGNVQMNTQKTYSNDGVSFSDSTSLGEAIRDTIRDWETTLHSGLETMYTGMSNQTFKDMRRILPVTKQKFDWSGQQMKLAGSAGAGTL